MSSPDEPDGHSAYEDMAVAHVLGGLDEERGRVFRAHLLECPHCRARVGELRAIASDLAGVERSARREQHQEESEGRLDTKEREEPPAVAAPGPSPVWPRLALAGLLVVVVVLLAYLFLLRGQVAQLEQDVTDRITASAVLEHGDEVPLTYEDPGVAATVRADGRDVAVVVDDLDDGHAHHVTLIDEAGDTRSVPAEVDDGRLLVLVRRRPADEGLRVERDGGELIMEADLTG